MHPFKTAVIRVLHFASLRQAEDFLRLENERLAEELARLGQPPAWLDGEDVVLRNVFLRKALLCAWLHRNQRPQEASNLFGC